MTRRAVLSLAGAGPALASVPLVVPLYLIADTRAKFTPQQMVPFSSVIWPEALRDFRRCGIQLQVEQGTGEMRRAPSGRPFFTGLSRGVINLMLTDAIPREWDQGKGLAGVTTQHEAYHLCLVALRRAHGHQIPFLSVNTCVHELLHVLMHDIFEMRPKGWEGNSRELRIDWYATRLWLFHDGAEIRRSTAVYLERLRSVLI